MKEKVKKIIYICIIIILTIILIFLFQKIYNSLLQKNTFEKNAINFAEKNEKKIFSIDKVIFFSSCDSKNKTSSPTNFTIENLYTYTDIALFINNNSDENTLENTLKDVKINNIKFTKQPELGKPNLYYKSINNFAKSELEEKNLIEEVLEFEVVSKDEADLSKPLLYNNCANPITLSYINQNIKTDYTMTDTQNPVTYNGKLLERCQIQLDEIETEISFDIEIENNKNQKFKTSVFLDIPYKNNNETIYNGNYKLTKDTQFNFYRYE